MIALTGVTAAAFLRQENYPLGLWVIAIFAIGLIIGLLHGFLLPSKIPAFLLTLATMGILRGIGFIYTQGRPIYIKSESFRSCRGLLALFYAYYFDAGYLDYLLLYFYTNKIW